MKRYDVDRMGEIFKDVTAGWLASIVTVSEMKLIQSMTEGDKLTFKRDVTGPIGAQKNLIVWRVK